MSAPAAALQQVLAQRGTAPHALLQVLRETQALTGWLAPATLAAVADALGLSLAHVQGVASFYRFLHQQPVGRYRVLFSDNITDRMAGSELLLADLCQRLGVQPGELSADGRVSVARCSCTGLGDQGPALLVNHHAVLTRLDAARVAELAALILADVPVPAWPADWFRVDDQIRRTGPLLAPPLAPGAALRACLARGSQATLQALADSKLRGRGGAGFPTARKWTLCRDAAGADKVVVCNADEGEPGTFKDRVLLSRHADDVFEGMTVAARLIGARQGFVYLRGEYRYLLDALETALQRRRERQLLGDAVLGEADWCFDIQIHVGAGAYVCGEESALIESLEGRRGTPRIRPPFPVEQGYLGRPTVVNNVETFCAAARIALHGAAFWTALGTPQSSGSKLHSVSGDCARPGIYELPWGVSVADLLAECGATGTQAVQVGGPSGLCLSADQFQRRLGFEDVPTAGAFMVFDDSRDMFEVAHCFAHFFAHESCGFCTPCRVGTELVARRMDKLAATRARGSADDLRVLQDLDALLHQATHCGLGASACNPLRDTLARFRPAFDQRLPAPQFAPGFDLDAELAAARRVTGRRDAGAYLEPPP